jgi:hypothetical protein
VDTGIGLDRGEDWAKVERLIELARRAHRTELSPERRERIRRGLLEKLERNQRRRRMARAFAAGASTVLLAGLLLKMVSGLPWVGRWSSEVAGRPPAQPSAAE